MSSYRKSCRRHNNHVWVQSPFKSETKHLDQVKSWLFQLTTATTTTLAATTTAATTAMFATTTTATATTTALAVTTTTPPTTMIIPQNCSSFKNEIVYKTIYLKNKLSISSLCCGPLQAPGLSYKY
jgi:hypothetical protein